MNHFTFTEQNSFPNLKIKSFFINKTYSVAAGKATSMSAHTNMFASLSPAAPLDLLTDYEKLQSITPDPILPLWLANPAKSPRGCVSTRQAQTDPRAWLWTCYVHVSPLEIDRKLTKP